MDNERLTPYLRRRCLALRPEDRVALISVLRESLTESPRTKQEERLEVMAAALDALTGLDVRRRSRRPEYVRARTIFSFAARQEGFSQMAVARFIHQDHATIHYNEERMAFALENPAAFDDYIELYNLFTSAIL